MFAFVGVMLFSVDTASAQGTQPFSCGGGVMAHLATEAEAANSKEIIVGKTYVCNIPKSGISETAGEAKEYLTKLGRAGSCKTASPEAFQQLNNAFAICAARFFKEYQARYGTVYITSAFRSEGPNGTNKCAGGVDGSNHTRGVAMDVHPNSGNYDSMMNFAKANPQLGVCFPRPLYNGKPDLPHMIIGGLQGGEGERCAAQGITKACSGVNFDPNSIRPASAASTAPPTSQLANSIRQALGGQQQPQLAPQPALPQQPLGQQQSPTNAFNQSTPALVPTSSLLEGGTAVSSVADRLEELTFGLKATSTQSATSVPLIINGNDVGGITSNNTQSAQSNTTNTGGSIAQQTFVSKDLNQSPTSAASSNRYIQALAQLKTVLLQMLQYLRPFAARGYSETESYE